MKKTTLVWLVVVIAVVVAAKVGCDLTNIPTAADAEEANRIRDALLSKFEFPKSTINVGEPAVFVRPQHRYSEILIYGITDGSKQQAICEALRQIERELKAKRIVVEFYREEKDRSLILTASIEK